MSRKSDRCFGHMSKAPLTEYDNEHEALAGADYASRRYGGVLVPYLCETCDRWHLSPADRQTPNTPCGYCFGRDGRNKATYATEGAAERRAEILYEEQGVELRAYACPDGGGWHLTKNLAGW